MAETERPPRPWPGPRPYKESEWMLFHGREAEIDEAEDRVYSERITLLAGRSGSGKTSLLRAGIVPRLRLRRYRDGEETTWPVLLLREWGAGRYYTFDELARAELQRAVEAIGAWSWGQQSAREDFRLLEAELRELDREGDFLEHIRRLVKKSGGVILVLDQLEEVLRLGRGVTRETTAFLCELFEAEKRVRLVLSLREEYLSELRDLEKSVGGLFGRTIFLAPMKAEKARAAAERAAQEYGLTVEPEVLDEVFRWLRLAAQGEDGAREPTVEESSQQTKGAFRAGPVEDFDLLTLQAILYELFEQFRARRGRENDKAIGGETLNQYIVKLRNEYGQAGETPENAGDAARKERAASDGKVEKAIARDALARWVGRTFSSAIRPGKIERSVSMPRGSLVRLVERSAVRVAPHLSSAGYKVAQEESDLFRKAMGDDVWGLGLRDPSFRGKVRIVDGEEKGARVTSSIGEHFESSHLNVDDLPLDHASTKENARLLSGVALEQGWSPRKAAEHLAVAFLSALERLSSDDVNIVKAVYRWEGERVKRWELVHDGLGPALSSWAETRKESWSDCAASIVACRGVSPIGVRLDKPPRENLRHIRWEGCQIVPVGDGEVILKDLDLDHCMLRGSIFERMVFSGCRFNECELDGTVFLNCKFERSKKRKTTFEACHPGSMAILGGEMEGVIFQACELSQLTMRNIELSGSVVFKNSPVELANFIGLSSVARAGGITFDRDSPLYHCSGDRNSWNLMDRQGEQIKSDWRRPRKSKR